MSDKELPPSKKKLRKGLEESQDTQSQEVTSLTTIVVLSALVYFTLPRIAAVVAPLLHQEPLALHQVDALQQRIDAVLGSLSDLARTASAEFLVGTLLAGLIGNFLNRRRPPGLKIPEISYNPLNSAKQMFKPSQLIASVKLWLVCVVVLASIALLCWWHLPDALASAYTGSTHALGVAGQLPLVMAPVVLFPMVLSAIIDAMQKHREFIKQNRMDHEEVKRENKEDNGDPMIKLKRKRLAQEA